MVNESFIKNASIRKEVHKNTGGRNVGDTIRLLVDTRDRFHATRTPMTCNKRSITVPATVISLPTCLLLSNLRTEKRIPRPAPALKPQRECR